MDQDDKSKAQKWVGLVILTYFMYTLPTLFQTGDLIFPSPFNDLLLIILSVLWFYNFRKSQTKNTIILFIYLLFRALMNPYYWNFVFPIKTIELMQKSALIPYLQVVPLILLNLFVLIEFRRKAHLLYYTSVGTISLITLTGILFGLNWIYLIQLGLIVLTLLIDRFRHNIHTTSFYATPYLLLIAFLLECFAFVNHL